MSEIAALVYTDVVESTLLNARWGDEVMNRAWIGHDSAARELMRTWGGREVGRGDGFLVIFPSVQNAVRFALAYHRSLAMLEPPLEARVGVHVGPISLRENSAADTEGGATRFEMDGLAVPVVTRNVDRRWPANVAERCRRARTGTDGTPHTQSRLLAAEGIARTH